MTQGFIKICLKQTYRPQSQIALLYGINIYVGKIIFSTYIYAIC